MQQFLSLNEALTGNATKRFDPEFFNKAAVEAFRLLKDESRLGDFVKEGYRVVYENTKVVDREEGIEAGLPCFLQSSDITTPFINQEQMVCVPESDWTRYPKGRISPGELLVEVKGKAEKVAVVPDNFPERTLVTGTCFKLTTKHDWQRSLLLAHLTGKYGNILKERQKTNLLVSYIAKDDLYNIPIPHVGRPLAIEIHRLIQSSLSTRNEVLRALERSEEILLSALGLMNWTPTEQLSYSARASDVFKAKRWDAQYFRPLFDEVEQRLLETGEAIELGKILNTNSRGRQPNYADEGLSVVNSKHVRANKVMLSEENRRAEEANSPVIINKGDVLVNGTGVGTIGRAAAYLHEQRALPDNHVTVLRSNHVDPIYLAVFLNSQLGQLQIERHTKGSSGQIELYPNDIAKIVFWNAPQKVQLDIRDSVLSAFNLEHRSYDLIEIAKRAVEIVIEEGEDAAMSFISSAERTY